jgi:hypothetical protein
MGWHAFGIVALISAAAAQAPPPTLEQRVKSAFILNFVDYTEWPAAPGGRPGELVICTLVEAPAFAAALRATIDGEVVGGAKLTVRPLTAKDDPTGCSVLFVSSDAHQRWRQLQTRAGGSVLTIGETPGFLNEGGVINFVTVGTRVRFEISLREATRRGVRLSAKVLRLATRVVQDDK